MSITRFGAGVSIAGLMLTGGALHAQELSELPLPPNGMNPKAEVSQWIGLVKVMDEAIGMADAPVTGVHQYGASLLAAGQKDKAMKIFTLNRQRHPDDGFVTYVGLARGYTALGDTKSAIANREIAIKNIPDNQRPNLAIYEQALKALRDKG